MIKILTIIFTVFLSFNFSYAEIVNDIKITGNERVGSETIKVYGDIEIGKDYQKSDLNKIIKNLYSTNFFEDIQISIRNNILLISLKEFPLVNQLIIVGEQSGKYKEQIRKLIKKNSYVASIDGVLNAVIIDGKPIGQTVIQGEGAGPAATTSALVSDISSILRGNIKFPFSLSSKERKKLRFNNIVDRFFSAYLRFEVIDKPGILSDITNIFSKNNVSIKRLVQNPDKNKKSSSIIIITHKSKDKFLNKILNSVAKKNYIKKSPKLIRIDEN